MVVETQEALELSRKIERSHAEKIGPQSAQSPNLLRGESLITFRWESMNALDIASVLDSTFPSQSDSSTLTCEEGYSLYDDDGLWMQPDLLLSKEVENCVADHLRGDTKLADGASSKDAFPTNSGQAGEDCTSLFISNQDGALADCEWGNVSDLDEIGDATSLSTFEEMAESMTSVGTLQSPLLSCSLQKESSPQLLSSDFCNEILQSIPLVESMEVSSITQCPLADMRNELTASQHSCCEPDAKPQLQLRLPLSDAHDSLDGRTARARRVAANQRRAGGRAKKHLPYRLLPMPSPTTIDRSNRVDHFPSEEHGVHFPLTQQPLQCVRMAPGAQFQPSVSSSPAINGNEYTMLNESLEAGLVEQLKYSVRQLDGQTRLCIRDSLYRLAKSAKERQHEAESSSVNKFATKPTTFGLRDGAEEAATNSLDRWVVNLLFCKLPNVSSNGSQPYGNFATDGTSQRVLPSTLMNRPSQPWNACRILPDFRLCTY